MRIRTFLTLAGYTNVMQFQDITRIIGPDDLIHNIPVISLIFANTVTIALAIIGNWDLATVMFIYWAQSIIIGIFSVISLLGADTAALRADLQNPIDERGGSVTITPRFVWVYKCLLAGFFCLHYGLFHWGYYVFIVESGIFGTVNFTDPNLWLSCGIFFANHLYSHITYRHNEAKGALYVNEQFFTPYRRIVPMHLTIIFGSIVVLVLQVCGIVSTMPVLVLFLLLKTYTDISAHLDKHYQEEHPDEPVRYL
ncbi:MAG: DUF6498-containing protein [Methanoregula sp.]|nr:DUF6498-containing protein [Methanoregula sp.]